MPRGRVSAGKPATKKTTQKEEVKEVAPEEEKNWGKSLSEEDDQEEQDDPSQTESESDDVSPAEEDDYEDPQEDEQPMKGAKYTGANSILKFGYNDYLNVHKDISQMDNIDVMKTLIARAHHAGQFELYKTLKKTLQAMNHECTFPYIGPQPHRRPPQPNYNQRFDQEPEHEYQPRGRGRGGYQGNTGGGRGGRGRN